MQFGVLSGRGKTDALFVVKRMQEEYRDERKKLCSVLWILGRHLNG